MGNKLGFGGKNNAEQLQQDVQNNKCNVQTLHQGQGVGKIRILNDRPEDRQKKVVAVIVTFCCSGSYDPLFTTVQQKAEEGTRVEVYACDSSYIDGIIDAFAGKPRDPEAERMMASVGLVDSDCVVINWECCGGYASKIFPEGGEKVFKFLKTVLDRGHMAMFSDFSLKALIHQWDAKKLGPNPFVQTSNHTGNFQLRFSPGVLKEAPSAQLQIVGDMAEEGLCNVQAAGGTIVYCVDSTCLTETPYKLQVLTVVPDLHPPKQSLIAEAGGHSGSAGHVLLTYPSGGTLLTSMGHWIQLMKVDTSAQKVFQVAERQFGKEKADEMRQKWSGMNQYEQQEYVSSNAKDFVRNQAPCSNMAKKARKS